MRSGWIVSAFYNAVAANFMTFYEQAFLRDLVHEVVQMPQAQPESGLDRTVKRRGPPSEWYGEGKR